MSSASVNLATETAIVWPVSEAKVIPNWQKLLGETLAKHLTSCGFKSNFRGEHFLGLILFNEPAVYHSFWIYDTIVIIIIVAKIDMLTLSA